MRNMEQEEGRTEDKENDKQKEGDRKEEKIEAKKMRNREKKMGMRN